MTGHVAAIGQWTGGPDSTLNERQRCPGQGHLQHQGNGPGSGQDWSWTPAWEPGGKQTMAYKVSDVYIFKPLGKSPKTM